MDILDFSDEKTKTILEEGYVLALPTETVYGVGVRWDDENAYDRLCLTKNRRPDKAIAVMCSDLFDLDVYFEISPRARKVMKVFLPGPLTCLVRAKENAPYQSHLGTHIAGIRIPDKKELLEFLRTLPYPLQVTSANISGQPATASFEEVLRIFGSVNEVKGIVRGSCESGTPTTVVDLTGEQPIVIREGTIQKQDIDRIFFAD